MADPVKPTSVQPQKQAPAETTYLQKLVCGDRLTHKRNTTVTTNDQSTYFRPNYQTGPSQALQQMVEANLQPQHGWMYVQMEQVPEMAMTQREEVNPGIDMFNPDL